MNVRETADRDTPARSATCSALTKDFPGRDLLRRGVDLLSEDFLMGKVKPFYAIACNITHGYLS